MGVIDMMLPVVDEYFRKFFPFTVLFQIGPDPILFFIT
jgi:hypothetical protein